MTTGNTASGVPWRARPRRAFRCLQRELPANVEIIQAGAWRLTARQHGLGSSSLQPGTQMQSFGKLIARASRMEPDRRICRPGVTGTNASRRVSSSG